MNEHCIYRCSHMRFSALMSDRLKPGREWQTRSSRRLRGRRVPALTRPQPGQIKEEITGRDRDTPTCRRRTAMTRARLLSTNAGFPHICRKSLSCISWSATQSNIALTRHHPQHARPPGPGAGSGAIASRPMRPDRRRPVLAWCNLRTNGEENADRRHPRGRNPRCGGGWKQS